MGIIDRIHLNELKDYFINEIFGMGIGWITGLLSVQLVSNFFEKSSWANLWGGWSDKMVVEESTYTIGEWIITAIIGFIVMKIATKLSLLFLKKPKKQTKIEVL